MAKISLGDKAARVLQFVIGAGNPRAHSALAAHGFTHADIDEAWKLLQAVGGMKRGRESLVQARAGVDTIAKLDAWENRWFPVAAATVERRFPAVNAELFKNLSQTTGPDVILSVRTFIERFDAMAAGQGSYGAEGPMAKAVLEARGLTTSVLNEARALYESIGRVETSSVATVEESKADLEKAEADLWAWYKEWSGIARVAISQRSILKELGVIKTRSRTTTQDEEDAEEEEGVPTQPGATAPVAPVNGTSPTGPVV